jgi:transposase
MNMHPQGGVANRDQRPNAGVDVCKQHLDVCLGMAEQRLANDASGWSELAAKCKDAGVDLVVLEATGGYERGLVCALQDAGITVARVNPRGARDFARSMGVPATAAPAPTGPMPMGCAARRTSGL